MKLVERKSHRLEEYDYSQNGYYYVTICTKDKRDILATVGNVVPDVPKIMPTAIGKIAIDTWTKMSEIDANIETDYFCLMPNHIHGIIIIENQKHNANDPERRGRRSLQDLVKGFKSVTTRQYNKLVAEQYKNTLWQSSFYDEIIRNEKMLYEIRKYIIENPAKWTLDKYFCR